MTHDGVAQITPATVTGGFEPQRCLAPMETAVLTVLGGVRTEFGGNTGEQESRHLVALRWRGCGLRV